MADVVEQQHDSLRDIDWVKFFESIPDSGDLFPDCLFLSADPSTEPPAEGILGSSQASASPQLGEIEQFLLEDGNEVGEIQDGISQYMSDFLLDFPKSESGETDGDLPTTDRKVEQVEEVGTAGGGIPSGESELVDEKEEMEKGDTSDATNGGGEDSMSKKRKRQLRNRDSAMKSRERKKLYIKDLEMKSKFMEEECRRLEFTLRCCMAENQILRQLQTSGASAPKQESAALPSESLLLGSLFWLMSIVLFLHPLAKKVGGLQTIEQEYEIVEAVREARTEKEVGLKLAPYLPLIRRLWKALRRKMKLVFHLIAVLIELLLL